MKMEEMWGDHIAIEGGEALSDETRFNEAALELFTGTVVAVSHDRAFLRRLDRFLLIAHDGAVYALPDPDTALEALTEAGRVADVRLAKCLTQA